MFSLLFSNNKDNKQKQKEEKIYQLLGQFYGSFFTDTYNELNIGKYRQLRDAIGLVRRKFEAHDHPLAYTSKLVMYIQARVAMKNLYLTKEQEKYMRELTQATKHVSLAYVYTGRIDSGKQFTLA